MHQPRRLILALWASIAAVAFGLNAAAAQEALAPGGYQFFVTPYLWLSSVHATTMTPLAREPEVNSNVSFIDLLSHLDGAPFMGSFEARYVDEEAERAVASTCRSAPRLRPTTSSFRAVMPS